MVWYPFFTLSRAFIWGGHTCSVVPYALEADDYFTAIPIFHPLPRQYMRGMSIRVRLLFLWSHKKWTNITGCTSRTAPTTTVYEGRKNFFGQIPKKWPFPRQYMRDNMLFGVLCIRNPAFSGQIEMVVKQPSKPVLVEAPISLCQYGQRSLSHDSIWEEMFKMRKIGGRLLLHFLLWW